MSNYTRTRRSMGDLAEVIGTAADVASDPYLSEVLCRVQQLKAIERNQAVAVCPVTPDFPGVGVGLRKLMPALRGYVYAERNPWAYLAAAAVVIGVPMFIGYQLGKNQ